MANEDEEAKKHGRALVEGNGLANKRWLRIFRKEASLEQLGEALYEVTEEIE